jgi:hypothetical protein
VCGASRARGPQRCRLVWQRRQAHQPNRPGTWHTQQETTVRQAHRLTTCVLRCSCAALQGPECQSAAGWCSKDGKHASQIPPGTRHTQQEATVRQAHCRTTCVERCLCAALSRVLQSCDTDRQHTSQIPPGTRHTQQEATVRQAHCLTTCVKRCLCAALCRALQRAVESGVAKTASTPAKYPRALLAHQARSHCEAGPLQDVRVEVFVCGTSRASAPERCRVV